MATLTQAELAKTVQAVQTKAATDPQFRQQVLTDPNGAIESITGQAVPEGLTLQVVEADAAADMTIVLPPLQSDELSDQELDSVAGGRHRHCSSLCFMDYCRKCPLLS